jgi:hypothetical protein
VNGEVIAQKIIGDNAAVEIGHLVSRSLLVTYFGINIRTKLEQNHDKKQSVIFLFSISEN